ncbi:hypothetical protein, partial [Streptomyces sp. NPDC059762]|uniref:hypothetical protein n=1 Tax=Streptomyces sp. NPDC059762 TaxID=3346938 RepID=UPI00365727F0
ARPLPRPQPQTPQPLRIHQSPAIPLPPRPFFHDSEFYGPKQLTVSVRRSGRSGEARGGGARRVLRGTFESAPGGVLKGVGSCPARTGSR